MDKAELGVFFSLLKEKKKSFEENYQYFAPQLAPKFNVFNFVKRDEISLSFIISDLMNPNGGHAQGDVFLVQFIEILKAKSAILKEKFKFLELDTKYASCKTESTTNLINNNKRRIDIVIDFQCFGIGIENKPWACDQTAQLNDYADELQRRYPKKNGKEWLLIYLSGEEWQPPEDSISGDKIETLSQAGNYIQITFSEIRYWLLLCEAKCRADRVRNFLRDFAGYCDKEFCGNDEMNYNKLIEDFLLSSKDNLAIGFEIENNIEKVKTKLSNRFADKIQDILKKELPNLVFEKCDNFGYSAKKNGSIYIYEPDWELCIGVGFDNYDGFYWGITKYERGGRFLNTSELNQLEESLNRKIKRYSNNKWWYSFIVTFEEPYSYWFKNTSVWQEIMTDNDTLANVVVSNVKTLYSSIKDKNINM